MIKNLTPTEEQDLRLLELVEKQEKLTQRGIAIELQIAIGLANSLVKRMAHKGYVKMSQIPSGRYAYYLTPQGFIEKSRLVSKYISNSVQFLGNVRKDYEKIAYKLKIDGKKNIACVGTGEIFEISQLVFKTYDLNVTIVVDLLGSKKLEKRNCLSALADLKRAQVKSLILTESNRPHKVFELLSQCEHDFEVICPEFMKISPKKNYQKKTNNSSFIV